MRVVARLAIIANLLLCSFLLLAHPYLSLSCPYSHQELVLSPRFHCQPWHNPHIGNVIYAGEKWECGGDNRFPAGLYTVTICD